MIPVTKPFLPPIEEYNTLIQDIFDREWLTNNGPLVNELELKLKSWLGLDHLLYVGNGTIALQIAIKALGLSGKVITTPFSYIATASSLVWEGCSPVFVDIEANGFNIDPDKIREAITPEVTGIVATHCFGIPCDVVAIEKIARENNLKVIYDGAHAFGTTINGRSIFEYGDVSTCSFHATKLFHTIEGGMVCTTNPELLNRMASMRNFGHAGPETFDGVGINGKNSEFHAAMGLVSLNYLDDILNRRKQQCGWYASFLSHAELELPEVNRKGWNCSYYPAVFSSEEVCLQVKAKLEAAEIFPRRYFFPSLNQVNDWSAVPCEVSESTASRVLCLPLYHDLQEVDVHMISRLILRTLNYAR